MDSSKKPPMSKEQLIKLLKQLPPKARIELLLQARQRQQKSSP